MKAKKSLGQNFLIKPEIAEEIVKAAEVSDKDTIVEIGPGLGILTRALLNTGAKVYAIEKDFELVEMLRKAFGNNKNLKIIHQDALFFDPSILGDYKIVANLPFNVGSPLIRKFLENQNQPKTMTVMLQKEVAEKIVAKPGSSERGILTLAVEYYAQAEIVIMVSKTSFRPQPKVDAAVIKIIPQRKFSIEAKSFFQIIKAGFSSKRRQIHNPLSATLHLDKNTVLEILQKSQIDPQLRAEDLSLGQWIKLHEIIKKGLGNI
ncbi:MAG: 16S rRNA (adenine(1518)-N(6)/adenine(1519)-N(6))-dimethyltransferase RsmA [Patescibacteria group bacterium]